MKIPILDELELEGRTVFIRVDFNVPLDEEGKITDDRRIREALPTIRHAIDRGGRVVLASHLGRPKGKPNPAFSLLPVGERLSELLELDVVFGDDCVGDAVRRMTSELAVGGVILLENLRFHGGEEKNDRGFARQLAAGVDVWVMDAFGTAHRAHASTAGMAEFVEARAAGFLVKKELEYLGRALQDPKRPFMAVLGGAKVTDKIRVIDSLITRCDALLIGGAMAYTFLKADGQSIGESRVEDEEGLEAAARILDRARERKVELRLPIDHLVVESLEDEKGQVTEGASIPTGKMGVDIGPRTLAQYRERLAEAGTVFWNGPMGIFEREAFARGTLGVAEALAASGAISVVGGGDSASAVEVAGVADRITHVSTGGGASLKFLEGKPLPALQALAGES
ncbi:MAG: phosphoglycerate kinase [Deltaproteobacteria bacterium]|nr:phosphoglycerate kinase [Deltaproteobacteria bacterium]